MWDRIPPFHTLEIHVKIHERLQMSHFHYNIWIKAMFTLMRFVQDKLSAFASKYVSDLSLALG